MKNSADLEGCYPPWPSASADNTLLDLQNSSYPIQSHSIIAKYQHERLRVTTFPVENTMHGGIFLTNFEEFGNVVKHFLECLKYLLNRGKN